MSSRSSTTSTRAAPPPRPCSLPAWRSMSCPTVLPFLHTKAGRSLSPLLERPRLPLLGLSTRLDPRFTIPRGQSSPRVSRPHTRWVTEAASVCKARLAGINGRDRRGWAREEISRGPQSYQSVSRSAVPRPASSCRADRRTPSPPPPPPPPSYYSY